MTRTRRYELTLLFCYCCCRDETSDSEMTKLRLRDTKDWQAQLRSCVYKRDDTRRCRCVIPLPPIQLCHRSLLPLLSMSFTCPYQNSIWLTLSELVCDVHIGIFEGLGTVSPSIFLVWVCLLAQISNNWTSNKHLMALETERNRVWVLLWVKGLRNPGKVPHSLVVLISPWLIRPQRCFTKITERFAKSRVGVRGYTQALWTSQKETPFLTQAFPL